MFIRYILEFLAKREQQLKRNEQIAVAKFSMITRLRSTLGRFTKYKIEKQCDLILSYENDLRELIPSDASRFAWMRKDLIDFFYVLKCFQSTYK